MEQGTIEITRKFRLRFYTTTKQYFEVDVRSEDLTDFEVRALTTSIRDVIEKTVCKNQIAHSSAVRVPSEAELLVPSDN